MDPATIAAIISAIAAVGGPVASSLFSGGGQTSGFSQGQQDLQSDIQRAISGGGGPLSFLDPNRALDDFDRLIGDPARDQFQNLTIPQIQQRFAGVGQLRGTSAGDTIARSGADIDAQIAELAFKSQQSALDRALAATSPALKTAQGGREDENIFGSLFSGIGEAAGQEFNLIDFIKAFRGGGNVGGDLTSASGTTSPAGGSDFIGGQVG